MPGGGGLGDPLQRDPRKVLKDVVHGLITVEDASTHYGVVLTMDGDAWSIDEAATRKARGGSLS